MWAIRIAIAGFIVPFMAVYNPALMMQGGDWGATLYMLFKAAFAVGLWAPCSLVTCSGPWRCGKGPRLRRSRLDGAGDADQR